MADLSSYDLTRSQEQVVLISFWMNSCSARQIIRWGRGRNQHNYHQIADRRARSVTKRSCIQELLNRNARGARTAIRYHWGFTLASVGCLKAQSTSLQLLYTAGGTLPAIASPQSVDVLILPQKRTFPSVSYPNASSNCPSKTFLTASVSSFFGRRRNTRSSYENNKLRWPALATVRHMQLRNRAPFFMTSNLRRENAQTTSLWATLKHCQECVCMQNWS